MAAPRHAEERPEEEERPRDDEEGSPGRCAPGSRAVSGLDERSRTCLEEIPLPGNVPDGKCRAVPELRTAS